jgi:hypothetical protein
MNYHTARAPGKVQTISDRLNANQRYTIVMNCDARGSELRGFGDDLWKLGLRYSTHVLQYSRYCSRGEAERKRG